MKTEIKENLADPHQLERLYRSDKSLFKRTFNELYPEIQAHGVANYWNERLNYVDTTQTVPALTWLPVIVASLIAGLIAKFPAIFNIKEEFFYPRNIGFIVFPILIFYFIWKNKISAARALWIILPVFVGLVFINFLPDNHTSSTLALSCIHLLLLLWSLLCIAFVGGTGNINGRRLDFLKFNGDLVVMTTLILIAGGIMTGITIGLFSLIGLNIEKFYFQYVVVIGLAAAPIIGTYLIQTSPQLVGKVSPVIAKLFSPLVVVMLTIYLIAIAYAGKDPYNDREFLIIFNALLIGVMAIIFFSVAEGAKANKNIAGTWILLLLAVLTIIVNGIALSAIIFRIAEWGITPNRAAVLGGNALIFVHLIWVNGQLFKVLFGKHDIGAVGKAIGAYLPVYFLWTIVVTFIFPFLFSFR